MTKTVVGFYDSYDNARSAVRDLLDAGFDRNGISVVANDVVRHSSVIVPDTYDEASGAMDSGLAQGAGAGAAAGAAAGLIVGLAALMVPGIGPILAVGPLAGMLIGAGFGLVVGGLLGALIEAGIPHPQAEYYAEGVRRGGTLVTLQAGDSDAERAMDILDRHDPVDVEMRAQIWRQAGWTAYDPKAAPYTAEEIARERARCNAAHPMPFLPPAEALSSTTPTYQAGIPVPPVAVAPVDATEAQSIADIPEPDSPNPPARMVRRPVAVYPYTGMEPRQTPPMPMETLPRTDRELAGAKGGEADKRAGGRPDDYQNSDMGGEVSVFDSLTEKP